MIDTTTGPDTVVQWRNTYDARVIHTGTVLDTSDVPATDMVQYADTGYLPVRIALSGRWDVAPALPVTTVAAEAALPALRGDVRWIAPGELYPVHVAL